MPNVLRLAVCIFARMSVPLSVYSPICAHLFILLLCVYRTGKTYVITGGVSGLGLATAKLLYGQGANVSLFDLNQELGDKVMAESFSSGTFLPFALVSI